MSNLSGNKAPNSHTVGAIGDIYTDLRTGDEYECLNVITITGHKKTIVDYVWKPIVKDGAVTMPDTLVPENIVGGVDIAGVVGSHVCSVDSSAASAKEVNFYDYDGTCLYAYTVEEAQALTELPSLPERPGLICQGWNWSLEDIKARNRTANVGATYITDDGTTRIYIHLEDGRTSPMLGVYLNGTVYVDWGDGTTPTTLTGKNAVVYTPNHNYAEPGDYVICLTVDGEIGILGSGGDSSAYILRHSKDSSKINKVYHNSVRKIEMGNCVTSIGNSAFSNCYSLTSISIPNSVASIDRNAFYHCYSLAFISIPDSVTSIGINAFSNCHSLTSISIPNSVTSISDSMFYYCYSLASISIPNSVTSINSNAFYYCYSLASIDISDSVTSIGDSAFKHCRSLVSINIPDGVTSISETIFNNCHALASVNIPDGVTSISYGMCYYCYSLASISIPNSVTSIDSNAFCDCNGVRYYDFANHTIVPTLSNTNVFSGIPTDCEILVPAALYDEWIAATNWSTYASYIKAV